MGKLKNINKKFHFTLDERVNLVAVGSTDSFSYLYTKTDVLHTSVPVWDLKLAEICVTQPHNWKSHLYVNEARPFKQKKKMATEWHSYSINTLGTDSNKRLQMYSY